ncbi:MAG: Asp-tRNA(Asn)/Glu-tRNA(Gln) amidotransferase subunit GatC [Thiothrix sp.]|nr:Asp-tRNA(Asn)/Glu-tRNA(Gln) amidotransferase subunit GatC [Thiothrix sp.]HPQ95349.1 Asp-tRNA(Asn)/Glu-tRNA(Gln) amidotransferase subunit GatC [Thiolinea sp.]
MAITDSEVKKAAHLARLALADEQLEVYTRNLSSILALVDQLQAVDTTGVEPMAHPLDMAQRLREDVVTETNQRDRYQAMAPEVENGLYLVPKVIE